MKFLRFYLLSQVRSRLDEIFHVLTGFRRVQEAQAVAQPYPALDRQVAAPLRGAHQELGSSEDEELLGFLESVDWSHSVQLGFGEPTPTLHRVHRRT